MLRSFDYAPVECKYCDSIFIIWAKIREATEFWSEEFKLAKDNIPPLEEGTCVFIINKESDRFLDKCRVIKREHLHYRVEFPDGFKLWVPENWVAAPGINNDNSRNRC